MTYRTPHLRVIGPGSDDMLTTWGSKLIGVRLIDRLDGESDEAIFRFTRKKPYMEIPPQGTPYTVQAGWSAQGMALFGRYTFQRVHIFGEPKQGQQLHLICRAADFNDDLKKVDSQHFDKENGHSTLGDMFNSLFKSSGSRVLIHPDIASIPVPDGYALRWRETALDFAMGIAENVGAVVKPMDGKILILKRGSLQSVSGQDLPVIQMQFDENYSFDVEREPKYEYQEVSASYLDTDKGTLEQEKQSSGKQGAADALPHPFSGSDGAKRAAAAAAVELAGATGQGLFTKVGDPAATAGARVACSGFGTPIDETTWEAECVTHEIVPTVGWTTTVETRVVD
ncbi:phage late control D family protein [Methylobacterium platani]|uniref:Late control protein n=2 Tax=Methylobacterium platani TaxID=427683 RepID=A0A179SHY2_9HYPH|nr:hypothetical protein [Methylobacterium platani]KMO16519.1 hypothetical protein SQ03_14550 [Methylobacterium platani JCM 14648]OAS27457.1 hypothetical protein A5481_01460 [Methylobacterium platani]